MRAHISLLNTIPAFALLAAGCAFAQETTGETLAISGTDGSTITGTVLEQFGAPWAMTFLPDARSVVTEKTGEIWLLNIDGSKAGAITNAPSVTAQGQGGLGDFILGPDFAENGTVYISYVERDPEDDDMSGAVVEKAMLTTTETGGELSNREIIWSQYPKVTGNGHYSHRLAVSPDGYLFVTSGDRQKFTPAQDMEQNLGKVLRLNLDGTPAEGNPFYGEGGVTDEIWSLGHRNLLGIDFDSAGNLWTQEMGPRHGDELNIIIKGENYGYPEVSDGDHYSGEEIPDHDTRPEFKAPVKSWVPAISPGGLEVYESDLFSDWTGDILIGGLSSKALIRVDVTGSGADWVGTEPARYEWDRRIREVEEGPDGAVYVLEDTRNGAPGGRLIKLTPAD
ncbi:MAG: glucose dehydrogenase [Ponticaulis sp.]|nr:glucose dehydrogenase [Ponticaulis sp.]